MEELINEAMKMFREVERQSFVVKPAVPILYFGNRDAYEQSSKRIITVGLNPSNSEFPDTNWRRFPALRDGSIAHGTSSWMSTYLSALNSYFDKNACDPYPWFARSFEHLLNGLGCSYYGEFSNTAIHTDLCSPIATDPTWSRLTKERRETLGDAGMCLWHRLVESLKPDVVIVSVARNLLNKMRFDETSEWKEIIVFNDRKDGSPRKTPYRIRGRWIQVVDSKRTLLAFGQAAQTPFGVLGNSQKETAGIAINKLFHKG